MAVCRFLAFSAALFSGNTPNVLMLVAATKLQQEKHQSPPRISESRCNGLSQQVIDHLAVDVGQPIVAALEQEGQSFVVDA